MTSKRYTLGDVSRSLTPEKRDEEWRGEWAVALIYRPVGNILTVPLLRLSVRANQVTTSGLILALSLPYLALTLEETGYAVIGLLGMLICTLDCVDGNIARVTGSTSVRGRYLDAVTDVIARICLFAALGILVDRGVETPDWMSGFGLLYCLAGAVLYLTARLSRLFAQNFVTQKEKPSDSESGFIDRYLFPLFSGFDWLLPILILIAGYFHLLGWVALWLAVYGVLDLLYTQASMLKRLS